MSAINERIKQLPASMLETENVEHTVLLAEQIWKEYEQLSEDEQERCTEIEKVKELLNGNSHALDLEHIAEQKSILQEKVIGYLGSSITVGMKSENVSFPDYIGKRTGSRTIKQAISGGTLAYKKSDAEHDYREKISYIAQLLDGSNPLQDQEHLDLLLVQLSTNDPTLGIDPGMVTEAENTMDFDCSTTIGAIETILAKTKEKWNCPVMFYTNPYIQPIEYAGMDEAVQKGIYDNLVVKYDVLVRALYAVQKKWQIGIADLWNAPSFRQINPDIKRYFMADIIHPYKAGYLFWYAPFIQNAMEIYYKEHVRITG